MGAVALVALGLGGCTFFASDGGGPLRRDQLGEWLGLEPKPVPNAQQRGELAEELKATPGRSFSGQYSLLGDASVFSLNCGMIYEVPFSPAPGLVIKGRLNPWLRFVPGGQHGDWLYYDPKDPKVRQFYASEDEWDFLLGGWDRADAWDVATGERVAAQGTSEIIGLGLGWTRVRRIVPVDRFDEPNLAAVARPSVALDSARYSVREGNIVLLGILGWGRVNHFRYIQFLWFPFPISEAVP